MEKSPAFIHVVGVRCKPEVEAKFVKWYDETHVPLLLKFKGIKKATRYKVFKPEAAYPEYLTIFEFDSAQAFLAYESSPELAAATAERNQTWKEGGWDRMWRVQYQFVKTLSR